MSELAHRINLLLPISGPELVTIAIITLVAGLLILTGTAGRIVTRLQEIIE